MHLFRTHFVLYHVLDITVTTVILKFVKIFVLVLYKISGWIRETTWQMEFSVPRMWETKQVHAIFSIVITSPVRVASHWTLGTEIKYVQNKFILPRVLIILHLLNLFGPSFVCIASVNNIMAVHYHKNLCFLNACNSAQMHSFKILCIRVLLGIQNCKNRA